MTKLKPLLDLMDADMLCQCKNIRKVWDKNQGKYVETYIVHGKSCVGALALSIILEEEKWENTTSQE